MLTFLFNALLVIIGLFIIVVLLCLMVRVVFGLLRKLFPHKFATIKPPVERKEDEQ